ncbi:hypothetical protein MPTK1_6g06000 [Marchantia polymorpha subsp. ruderalis]
MEAGRSSGACTGATILDRSPSVSVFLYVPISLTISQPCRLRLVTMSVGVRWTHRQEDQISIEKEHQRPRGTYLHTERSIDRPHRAEAFSKAAKAPPPSAVTPPD